jgi:FkbM family methyltransferase
MPHDLIKRMLSYLPLRHQQAVKRRVYRRQITRDTFEAPEWEFTQLERWINPGDWVIDVGANIGHYTKRMSDMVGSSGRVFAIEPVADTFEILAANASCFAHRNVSLLNVAASHESGVLHVDVPRASNGLNNYFLASISETQQGAPVIGVPVDGLGIQQRVKLIKLDVEGHEINALRGMLKLLERDHPVLIVEGACQQVKFFLTELGYRFDQQADSVNRVFLPLTKARIAAYSDADLIAEATFDDVSFEDTLRQQRAYGHVGQINRVADAQVHRH